MSAVRNATVAVVIAAAVALSTVAVASGADAARASKALGPGAVTVTLDIEHSRFTPSELTVLAGTEVRFVLVNNDPINHELVVGPPEVHERHRDGSERAHVAVPGEVSVGPLAEASTIYRFDEVGTLAFACHLPGHEKYGMRGTVEVVERR